VFTSRNVFIVSTHGVRNVKGLTDIATEAATGWLSAVGDARLSVMRTYDSI